MRVLRLPKKKLERVLADCRLYLSRPPRLRPGEKFYICSGELVHALARAGRCEEKRRADGTVYYILYIDIIKKYRHPLRRIYLKYSRGNDPYELLHAALEQHLLSAPEAALAQRVLETAALADKKVRETELFLCRLLRKIVNLLNK